MVSKVLMITGMHRSGTSLAAQYLGECGLHIGSDLTSSALNSSRNYYGGHHEDREFTNFHKRILKNKFIGDFPTRSFRIPVCVGKKDREVANRIVKSRAFFSQWGWKDPRSTLFLDFWGEMIEDLHYLLLVRHPLSVVDSLLRRDHEKHISRNAINGIRVWNVYNQQILRFCSHNANVCVVFDIDEIIHDPDRLRCKVIEKFGFELKSIDFSKVFSHKAFRSAPSEQVEQMKLDHANEVDAALKLYRQLQIISRSD
ncbi:hypothetical protein C7B76_05440 [filamentous cyanobacterium CCP2]|nr:hypothetical protein C7B76_05440 [filamentous cyanobacterium CCP2]